jgi:hypothetical protein
MSESPPPTETGAPAPTSPEGLSQGEQQVQIALGPHTDIYPEAFRPALLAEPPAPPVEAPEPASTAAPETPPEPAGLEPPSQDGDTRGARRRAAEDAYQRGLTEGRAALEHEQAQRQQQDAFLQTQREANARVEQLFSELESPDYATQDRARQGILQMYRGNRQAQALMTTTRQQILGEMAADFAKIREVDGLSDEAYQSLHTAPSAAELAKRAMDIGRKSRDEQVTRLEAEIEGLRGRLVGSRATPMASNGAGAIEANMTIEQYQALGPKEAAKLSSAQVDAMMRQWSQDAQRNGH